jgi:hypothetical protein
MALFLLAPGCTPTRTFAAGTSNAPPPKESITGAASVVVYRLDDRQPLGSSVQLDHLSSIVGTGNAVTLERDGMFRLKSFVLDDGNYRDPKSLVFIPACGFVVRYAFAFRTPGAPTLWWLVTNCANTALVTAAVPAAEWSRKARYLTNDARARFDRCAASAKASGGTGFWAGRTDCLAGK